MSIAEKLTTIEYASFLGCSNLEKFVYLKDNKELESGKLNDSVLLHECSIYTYLPNGELELNAYAGGNKNKEFSIIIF